MFGRLIKWGITMLAIAVVGTVIGLGVQIVIAAVPLVVLVIAAMVVAVVLFRFAAWCIEHGGW